MTLKRRHDGTFAKGSAGGPGRLPTAVKHRVQEKARLAREIDFMCRELGFVRMRLLELEAQAQGTATKIRALADADKVR